MVRPVRSITWAEVRKHSYGNKPPKNVWMVINDQVYDVTAFLAEHPGGAEVLQEMSGKDATQAFEDVGHSEDARTLMKKYQIGYIPAGEKNTVMDPCCKIRRKSAERSTATCASSSCQRPAPPKFEKRVSSILVPKEKSSWWMYAIPLLLLIGVGAFVARKKMAG